ncbi:hypothetical protein SynA1825c_02368 [Synechococcus sp. A18-25c]|nr:hypothetical protein SynA1560_02407 [Synechococcus sp. A15-60]QNJ20660.1 hypothetical protein SynA1825c_02368 [Synechococcus sp. A18-25c]
MEENVVGERDSSLSLAYRWIQLLVAALAWECQPLRAGQRLNKPWVPLD